MRIVNRMQCQLYFRYAGRTHGSNVTAGATSVSFPASRFSDKILQRDWRLRRIDILLEDADRAALAPEVVREIEAFQGSQAGPPVPLAQAQAPRLRERHASTAPGKPTAPPRAPPAKLVPPRERKSQDAAIRDNKALELARPRIEAAVSNMPRPDRVIVDIASSPAVTPSTLSSRLPAGKVASLQDLLAANNAAQSTPNPPQIP